MDCKNHSGIPAKRKCYHCEAPVCSICQVRGSGHIFCSEVCEKDFLQETETKPQKATSAARSESLVPGTAHVDSAWHGDNAAIKVKNINMETFEAVQDVIERTDKELKDYLTDLELIFQSATGESFRALNDDMQKKWSDLIRALDGFKKAAEGSARAVESVKDSVDRLHVESINSIHRSELGIQTRLRELDLKINKVDSALLTDIPTKFSKLAKHAETISSSVAERMTFFKDMLAEETAKLGTGVSETGKKISLELADGVKGLRTHFESGLKTVETSIDTARDAERDLLAKNEETIKSFIETEKLRMDGVLSEYGKKFATNLSASKQRLTDALASGNAEVKEFLDFQRIELLKAVSRLAENLDGVLKRGTDSIDVTGAKLDKSITKTLEETGEDIGEAIDSFSKNLDGLFASQKTALEDTLKRAESEQRSLLKEVEDNIHESLSLEQAKASSALQGAVQDFRELSESSSSKFELNLKTQRETIEKRLSENSSEVKNSLSAASAGISSELRASSATIEEHLKGTASEIKSASGKTSETISAFVREEKENLLKFVSDSLAEERRSIEKTRGDNIKEISAFFERTSRELSGTNEDLRKKVESLVASKATELEQKLSLTMKNLEDTGSTQLDSYNARLSSSLDVFEKKLKDHFEKREKIFLDELALVSITNKGNLEEALNKNRADIDSQIKDVQRESGKLLKTEVTQSMDVFNLNLSALLGEIKDNLKKKVQALPTQFSLSPVIKGGLALLLLLAFVTPLFVYISFNRTKSAVSSRVDRMEERIAQIYGEGIAPATVPKEEPAKTATIQALREKPNLYVDDRASFTQSKVIIKGESKFGDFALLTVNRQRRYIRFITKKNFTFDEVELYPGENRLEVRAFSYEGNATKPEFRNLFFTKAPSRIYNLAYNVSRGDIRKPIVSLTFDGGSNSLAAPFILKTLRDKGIKTTIFLTGDFIQRNPDLVKQIVADGHEVGNHTFSHPHLIKNYGGAGQATVLSKADFEKQLAKTNEAFKSITGRNMAPIWRAPYGEINDDVLTWAKNLGYTHVRWTTYGAKAMDSLDWVEAEESHLYRTAEEIKNTILSFDDGNPGGSNGGIIIMHLGTNRTTDQPYMKLGEIIDGMRAKGYRFVKVTDLMESFQTKKVATTK